MILKPARLLPLFFSGCLCWCGCSQLGENKLDEESNRHFINGKTCASNADYPGAMEAFEKALEDNPHSGSAHFELGLVCYRNLTNYAEAVYHFDKFLQIRPNSPHAETVRQFIQDCKQELAKEVSLAAVSQKMQHEMENITRENERLKQQVDSLSKSLAVATNIPPQVAPAQTDSLSYAPAERAASNPRPATHPVSRHTPPEANISILVSNNRTYSVKPGDTPFSIARRNGITVNSLLAANPGLDSRHLKVGQVLRLPSK
jgi:LysM repeat protein